MIDRSDKDLDLIECNVELVGKWSDMIGDERLGHGLISCVRKTCDCLSLLLRKSVV